MKFPMEGIFDEAENRYLKPEELRDIKQYVASLPARMTTYRTIRDQEVTLVQTVVDELQIDLPDVEMVALERSVKNAMLGLRYCAIAMLTNNERLIQTQFLPWLRESVQLHETSVIDVALFQRLKHHLRLALNPQQMALFEPFLTLVEAVIPVQEEEKEEMLTLAGMF
jgi:hypothetical protein